jgi:hypothetical protein
MNEAPARLRRRDEGLVQNLSATVRPEQLIVRFPDGGEATLAELRLDVIAADSSSDQGRFLVR